MKAFRLLIMLSFLTTLTGCIIKVPVVDTRVADSVVSVKKAPLNVAVVVNESAIYRIKVVAGGDEYHFPVGQIMKKQSLAIFPQFFDKVEFTYKQFGKNLIIFEFNDLRWDWNPDMFVTSQTLYTSIRVSLLNAEGTTIFEDVISLPEMTRNYKDVGFMNCAGLLASESIAAAIQEAARESYSALVDPEYAIGKLNKRISDNPNDHNAFLTLASLYKRSNQYDRAITAAKRAAELKPDSANAYGNLGYAYMGKKQYAEAYNAFKRAIDIAPADSAHRRSMGELLLSKADYAGAAEAYRTAAEIDPKNPSNFFALANACRLMGKYDDALNAANQAIELQTIRGIGIRVSVAEDDYPVVQEVTEAGPARKAGIEAGDRIIRIDGKDTEGWKTEQVVQSMRGDAGTQVALILERNEESFEKLLTREAIVEKGAARAFGLRSRIYRQAGKPEEALKDSEKAYSLNPAEPAALLSLGAVHLDSGRYDESIKLLSQAGADPAARLLVATAYAKKGDMKEATNVYLSIAEEEMSPRNMPLMDDRAALLKEFKPFIKEHRGRAKSLESEGRYKEALAELSEALKMADGTEAEGIRETVFDMARRNPRFSEMPEESRKYALRGEVLIKEGDFEQAAAEFKKALRIAPYVARLYYNSALINAELKKYPEAVRDMKIYLKAVPDAPDSRAARDEIIKWEFSMENGKK